MKFLSSHVIHFFVMGLGMSMVLGMLTPTTRMERTKASIIKYALGLIGIGIALAWIMYLLPRNPIRF
jgi:MFS superfamily sulfate permease-like transporter